ncbi:MAG: dihydrofolate reductase [Clostridiales bacterium]|nr:dihydrofolate reductase [Clostridiales bacterium]
MEISIIAAVGRNYELGKAGGLIWRFHEDMVFFKKTTMPHSIIMGRKTFESLPHALPGRQNIVLTNNKNYKAPGACVALSKSEALACCRGGVAFIIGGEQIYREFIADAGKLYLTEIDAECAGADAYFPPFDKSLYTRSVLSSAHEGAVQFSHVLYEKR